MTTFASVLVSSFFLRANLDLNLTLYSTDGSTVLWTADPPTCSSSDSCSGATSAAMGASLSYTLPNAGKYYIAVRSTGVNDAGTLGYSAYGSLGQYTLTANFPLSVAGPPSLSPPPSPSPSPPPRSPSPPPPLPSATATITAISAATSGSYRQAKATIKIVRTGTTTGIAGTAQGRWTFVRSGTTTITNLNTFSINVAASGTSVPASTRTTYAGRFTLRITTAAATGYAWDRVQTARSATVAK